MTLAWFLFLSLMSAPPGGTTSTTGESGEPEATSSESGETGAELAETGEGETGADETGGAGDETELVEPELPEQVPEPQRRSVKIAVAGRVPFVVDKETGDGDEVGGLSLDVWRALADRTKLDYEVIRVPDARAAIEKIMTGRADVAVGPISITAWRARRVAFGQPYFQSSVAIMAPTDAGLWARIAPFISRVVVIAILGLLSVLLLVGTLFWLAERRRNPEQFPPELVRGIGNGMWAAIVTMTTVGYGDLAPRTLAGRVVAGVWMLVAMLTASSLTASIATALTLNQLDESSISEAEELSGKRVAAGRNTPAAEFAIRHGARVVHVESVEDGVLRVEAGEADALVFDRPLLRYYLHEHPESSLGLSPMQYDPTGYGFALKLGNPLMSELDVALLDLDEDGTLDALTRQWLVD